MKHKLLLKALRKYQIDLAQKHLDRVKDDYTDSVEKIYDLNYMNSTNENYNFDIYYPKGKRDEVLPVIMEIHGGGFCTGTKLINEAHGLWYASKGFKVVNVNYSLLPEVDYCVEMRELFYCLHWIEDHAEEYGFDTRNLFLSGDSGGGFNVLLLTAIQNSPELQAYYNIEPISCGIAGTAASCPCSDVREIRTSDRLIWRAIRAAAYQYDMPEDYLHHVSSPDTFELSNYPKVYIATSKDDNLLYLDSKLTHEQLEKLGIDHIYKEYVGKTHKLEHVWQVTYPDWEESVECNEDYVAYFKSMMK